MQLQSVIALSFDPSAVSSVGYALALSALVSCIILYLLYKLAWPRDFGMPVHRKVLCRSLRIVKDQMAFAPLWWTDVQVQRALTAHWRATLERGLAPSPPVAGAGAEAATVGRPPVTAGG